jgi:hypothetical protein
MAYYLHAGSAHHKGRRYARGQELPDDLGKSLVERGLAVTDRAELTQDLRPVTLQASVPPRAEQRTTIATPGVPVTDSTAGSATTEAATEVAADGLPSNPVDDPNADPGPDPDAGKADTTAAKPSTRRK